MSRTTDAREVILTSDSTGNWCSATAWDPRNGSLLYMYKGAGALGQRSLQLLSDSYLLGASSTKPHVHVWPLNNSSPNVRLTMPGKVDALTSTPNGSYIIAAVGEKLFIWQTCNGRLLANLTRHYQTINCLSTTKDGSLFASGAEDALVFVWSLYGVLNDERCMPIHTFSRHTLPVRDLCFGHGNARARLYTISLDGTANIYELGSGALLLSLVFDAPLSAVTVNICESELFVGCISGDIFQCNLHEPPRGIEHHVKVNTKDSAEESAVFKGHKSNITALSISVDCRTLLSGSTDGAIHIWDIVSRQTLRTIKQKGPVTAAFFAPGFENFRATTLKPRLVLSNFQRTSDDSDRESVVEVISRGRDPTEILDFESYVQASANSRRLDDTSRKLKDMKEEIDRLKKINNAMYKYSVTCILNKMDSE